MADDLSLPREIYEELWAKATEAFDCGNPRLDPFLKNRTGDRRRGVTLIARPDIEVRDRIQNFLRRAAEVAPDQYLYQPAQFHLTILSVVPGSELWQEAMQRLPDYLAVLGEVLRNRPAFSVAFNGVTASPETVMIQGFSVGDFLSQLRNDLRAALSRRGLDKNLDRRYKIVTAHLTVVRFSTPIKNWKLFKALLTTNRNTNFGETRVRSLQLVESDWYMSVDATRILREYPLS